MKVKANEHRDGVAKETKGVLAALLATVAVLSMSSCSCRQMTPTDLQGTWVPAKSSERWIKTAEDRSRCQIALRADGTFTATVPDYMMPVDQCVGRVMVGKGRWSLTTEWHRTSLKLRFSEIYGEHCDAGATPLYVQTRNRLMFWIGDPDSADRFEFERAPVQGEKK